MDTSLDGIVKVNKWDTCGMERKRFVLFPATDVTAGELFRAESPECESRGRAGLVGGSGEGDSHRF